jgi:hypothetical protein
LSESFIYNHSCFHIDNFRRIDSLVHTGSLDLKDIHSVVLDCKNNYYNDSLFLLVLQKASRLPSERYLKNQVYISYLSPFVYEGSQKILFNYSSHIHNRTYNGLRRHSGCRSGIQDDFLERMRLSDLFEIIEETKPNPLTKNKCLQT